MLENFSKFKKTFEIISKFQRKSRGSLKTRKTFNNETLKITAHGIRCN